jgi:hypothetical protein
MHPQASPGLETRIDLLSPLEVGLTDDKPTCQYHSRPVIGFALDRELITSTNAWPSSGSFAGLDLSSVQ